MSRDRAALSAAVAAACAVMVGVVVPSCTREHRIGSTCEDGVCESANLSTGVPCVIETSRPGIGPPSAGSDERCVFEPVPLIGGTAACRMFLMFRDGAAGCQAFGLPVIEVANVMGPACELPQLELAERGRSAEMASGWYIEGDLATTDSGAQRATQRLGLDGPLPARARAGACRSRGPRSPGARRATPPSRSATRSCACR